MLKWTNYSVIRLFCRYVGKDIQGNKYYISRRTNAEGYKKRFVLYKGKIEASKVPPMWHAWLHYMTDNIPSNNLQYDWQVPYVPNLTGTKHAYFPKMPVNKDSNEIWKPS